MKRHKALSLLSSDHHHGLRIAKLLKEIGHGTNLDDVLDELRTFYKDELIQHFEAEEKNLVPYFPNNSLLKKMCDDHKKIKEMFNALSTSNNLKAELISFGNFLENHIRFEERELFPMIEKTVSEDTLREIGSQIEKNKMN